MALIRSTWTDGKLEHDSAEAATVEPLGCDCRGCRNRVSRMFDLVATQGLRTLDASWTCQLGDTAMEIRIEVGNPGDPDGRN